MSSPLAPAIVLTVWPGGGVRAALDPTQRILTRLMRAAAPGDLAVCIHDPVNGDERPLYDLCARLGLRVWSAWGANPLEKLARAQGQLAATQLAARESECPTVEPEGSSGSATWDGEKHALAQIEAQSASSQSVLPSPSLSIPS